MTRFGRGFPIKPHLPKLVLASGTTTIKNDFEGGSNGATITTGNAGGTGNTQFNAVNVGVAATAAFDNTHAAHGTLSYKLATGASVSASDVEWTTAVGNQTTIYGRLYLYKTANPAASVRIATLATSGGASLCSGIYLMTDGTILGTNTSVGTACQTNSGNAAPNNAWFRVEFKVVCSATVGVVEIKLFNSPDSPTPTETVTGTSQNTTAGPVAVYSIGMGFDVKANVGPIWLDDIGFDPTGYLGPASVSSSTDAPADEATATGGALDAGIAIGALDTGAGATGLANDAVAGVRVNAGGVTGTGLGQDGSSALAVNDTGATATGTANNAVSAVTITPADVTVTGAANDSTITTVPSTDAPAGVASASGSANDAGVALSVNDTGATATALGADAVSAVTITPAQATATGTANDPMISATGVASATGTANDSAVALAVNDTGATLSGAAGDASLAVSITPADVTATGTANDATVTTGANTNAPADVASATGSANDASVALTVNDTGATLSGAASNASSAVMITPADVVISGAANGPVIGIGANDSGATATTTTNDGSSAVTVTPADVTGTGTANDPTITAAGSVNAPAGVASAGPIVDNPTIALTTGAVGATSSATAADPTIGAAADAVGATVGSAGQDALAALAASATGALSAGGALDALILVGVLAPAGVAGGSVLSADAVIAIGAMSDGVEASGLAIDAFATSGARRGEMNSTDRKVPVLLVGAGASPSAQASNDESAPTMQPGSRNAATMRDE